MPHNPRRRRGATGRIHRVVILYREPTYEARNGPREHPYRITFDVVALDHAHAEEKARAELLRQRAGSGVSWIIQVVQVLVTEIEHRASA